MQYQTPSKDSADTRNVKAAV
jgi:hypothetical protein